MMQYRRAMGVALGVLMAFNTACYSFVPAAQGLAPQAGDQVRVRFNADGTAGMTSALGPGVEAAEGTLNESRPDGSVVVGVVQVRLTAGVDRFWSGQNVVTIPATYIAGLDVRRSDRGKTRAAIIGGALAIGVIFALALATGGAHGNASPDTQPTP
ncbi:MAG: hypothetical protein U9Q74_02010 [Gemmatimonadota bacterium]|nr:hypothetical protein [Gemmatimonadota bacterium]